MTNLEQLYATERRLESELDAVREQIREANRHRADWSKAPTWAKWWGLDHDGVATWFEKKPDAFGGRWCIWHKVRHGPAGNINRRVADWQGSLEQRPI